MNDKTRIELVRIMQNLIKSREEIQQLRDLVKALSTENAHLRALEATK